MLTVSGCSSDDCSQCYIGETKRALTLRIKEHHANCRNQNQHSAVVDHSATGHHGDSLVWKL